MIFSKSKTDEECEFYIKLTIREKYSSRELERQMDSAVYERAMLTNENVSAVLREIHPDASSALNSHQFKVQLFLFSFLNGEVLTTPDMEFMSFKILLVCEEN